MRVGFEARLDDQAGTLIKRDSIAVNDATPLPYVLPLNFSPTVQGKKVRIRSFAYDGGGRLGYSVRSTSVAGTSFVDAIDTALVVYGRTYTLPVNRNGAIADLVVDADARECLPLQHQLRPSRGLAEGDAGLRRDRYRRRLAAVGDDQVPHRRRGRHAVRRELRRHEPEPRLHRCCLGVRR